MNSISFCQEHFQSGECLLCRCNEYTSDQDIAFAYLVIARFRETQKNPAKYYFLKQQWRTLPPTFHEKCSFLIMGNYGIRKPHLYALVSCANASVQDIFVKALPEIFHASAN